MIDGQDPSPNGGDRVLQLPGFGGAAPSGADRADEEHGHAIAEDALEDSDGDGADLAAALEAVCFALNRPLTVGEVASILERSPSQVRAAADACAARLGGHGLMLQRHNDELQLVTRPTAAWAVQRALNPERPGRLSRPALETLAIIAYRQPATRAAVEAIRGVNCEAVLDSLERRELIEQLGHQETPGHPLLYGTTLRFLQVVGLERIEDLPPLAEGESPTLGVPGFDLAESLAGDTVLPERGPSQEPGPEES